MNKKILLVLLLIASTLLYSCGSDKAGTAKDNGPDKFKGSTKKTSVAFSIGKQKIIKLQTKFGRDYVMKLDCAAYDAEGKQYCMDEKVAMSKKSDELTWESIQKKGSEFMMKFDCKELADDKNRKICTDWQKKSTTVVKDDESLAKLTKFMDLPWNEFGSFDCKTILSKSFEKECEERKIKHDKVLEYFKSMSEAEIKAFDCPSLKNDGLNFTCESYVKYLKSK